MFPYHYFLTSYICLWISSTSVVVLMERSRVSKRLLQTNTSQLITALLGGSKMLGHDWPVGTASSTSNQDQRLDLNLRPSLLVTEHCIDAIMCSRDAFEFRKESNIKENPQKSKGGIYMGLWINISTLLTQKHSENFRWECSWNIFMEFFLTFSEHLCGSFPHEQKGIFANHFTSESPIFTHHLKFMRSIFNIFQVVLCFVWNNVEHVNNRYLMKSLPRMFPEGCNCPKFVETLWKQLCVAGYCLTVVWLYSQLSLPVASFMRKKSWRGSPSQN